MTDLMSALVLMTIPLSCIAILLSCIGLAIIVGLKNSTHKIEWKTLEPVKEEQEEFTELDGEPMMVTNPNKKISRLQPFEPFPPPPKEEEPFFDEEDPNNVSHDYQS